MHDPATSTRWLGEWWLPSQPDRKVPGALSFSPGSGAELELIGVLRSPFEPEDDGPGMALTSSGFERAGNYGRICGIASEKAMTLEGCFQTSTSNILAIPAGRATERIYVSRIIEGAIFEEGEPVDATAVQVQLLHLPYWIAEGGIEESHLFDSAQEDSPEITLAARLLPDRRVELSDGSTLTLSETVRVTGDRVTRRGLDRSFTATITGQRAPLQEYLHKISALQDLVSMGLGRTATFEEFTFHHPDIVQSLPDGTTRDVRVRLRAEWSNWETRDPESPKHHERLFSLVDLGGDEPVRKWLDFCSQHRISVARIMSTRYRSPGLASDRLMNRAAALEALHRDITGKNVKFETRILDLATLAGEPFRRQIPDVAEWCSKLKTARDAIAHQFSRDPSQAGPADLWLAETAYYLFVNCALREISAGDAALNRLGDDQKFALAARRLREVNLDEV